MCIRDRTKGKTKHLLVGQCSLRCQNSSESSERCKQTRSYKRLGSVEANIKGDQGPVQAVVLQEDKNICFDQPFVKPIL